MTKPIVIILAVLTILFAFACQGSTTPELPLPPPPPPPTPPTLSFSASPTEIPSGGRCQLNFSTNGVRMILSIGTTVLKTYSRPSGGSGGWGIATLVYPTVTTTYTVRAENDVSSTTLSCTVTIK